MRALSLACAAVVSASMLAGCGPSAPDRVLSQPPGPAQTSAPMPVTQVDQPVNLTKFDSDPCGLLTKEQVAAVVADPPNDVSAYRQVNLPAFGCSWTRTLDAVHSALKPVQGPRTLAELSVSNLKKSGELEPWTETSIDGLPAVVYHEFGDMGECSVSVQVTEKQMLTFDITGKSRPGSYWDADLCGGVAKMAEFVIGNLRNG